MLLYESGNVTGSIEVYDKSIMSQLSENTYADVNYSISDNGSEALKLFKFAANHCKVEWGIEKFDENDKDRYFLGTLHETLKSPTVARAGRSMSSVVAGIHSHPNTRPDLRSELNSMGVDLGPYNEPYALPFRNDYSLKTDPDGLYKYSLYYIYMQKSQNVWEIKNDGNLIKMNFNEIKF